jgi:hypothetical protein
VSRWSLEQVVTAVRDSWSAGQFINGELVQPGQIGVRPPGPPRRCQQQYALLGERVLERLQRRG